MTLNDVKKEFLKKGFVQVSNALVEKLGVETSYLYQMMFNRYAYFVSNGSVTDEGFLKWDIKSVKEKTGVPTSRQKKAIQQLVDCGLIEVKLSKKEVEFRPVTSEEQISKAAKPTAKSDKPYDVEILRKQIVKAGKNQGKEELAEQLYLLCCMFFDRFGLPSAGKNQETVESLLRRFESLQEYDVMDCIEEYFDEYETIPYKPGHDLGIENFLTEEMLSILQQRIK